MPRFLQFIGPAVFGLGSEQSHVLGAEALPFLDLLQKTDDAPVMFVIDVAQSEQLAEFFRLALATKDRIVRHGSKGGLHCISFGGSNSSDFSFCLGGLDQGLLHACSTLLCRVRTELSSARLSLSKRRKSMQVSRSEKLALQRRDLLPFVYPQKNSVQTGTQLRRTGQIIKEVSICQIGIQTSGHGLLSRLVALSTILSSIQISCRLLSKL